MQRYATWTFIVMSPTDQEFPEHSIRPKCYLLCQQPHASQYRIHSDRVLQGGRDWLPLPEECYARYPEHADVRHRHEQLLFHDVLSSSCASRSWSRYPLAQACISAANVTMLSHNSSFANAPCQDNPDTLYAFLQNHRVVERRCPPCRAGTSFAIAQVRASSIPASERHREKRSMRCLNIFRSSLPKQPGP